MKAASAIILFVLIAIGITSCKKAYDPVPGDLSTGYLNVVNGTADTLNFYLNGTRQNSTSSIYPAGSTGYLTVTAGNQAYDFRKNLNATTLFTKSVNIAASDATDPIRYSLFLGGETADKAFYTIDTLDTAAVDSARVRFVHTSDATPAIDVMIDSSHGFKNCSFKSISKFTNFAATAGAANVNVYAAGTTNLLATQKITLSGGTIYTLYIKGSPTGRGSAALSIGVFVNH